MAIQNYPWELIWVNQKLQFSKDSNSFLRAFCEACVRADDENYELLRPVLQKLMEKYPVKTKEAGIEAISEQNSPAT